MANFIGVDFENHNYKLQHIVTDSDGNTTIKTEDILFWACFDMGTEVLHIPISKLDMEMNTKLTSPQLARYYDDRNRRLIRKDSEGVSSVIPFGGIAKDA